MAMRKPLPPAPDDMIQLFRFHLKEDELVARGLLVPLPYRDFQTPSELSGVWEKGGKDGATLKQGLENRLTHGFYGPAPVLRSIDEPFYPTPYTTGSMCSPYTAVPDRVWWMFMMMHKGDEARCRHFFTVHQPALGSSVLEAAQRAHRGGLLEYIRAKFSDSSWLSYAYSVKLSSITGGP